MMVSPAMVVTETAGGLSFFTPQSWPRLEAVVCGLGRGWPVQTWSARVPGSSQTAIPYFGEAPQLFDYPKGVFAARPGPRARPVDHSPALAQGPLGGGAAG